MAKHNKKKVGRQTRKNRKRQKEILDSDLSKSKQPHSMVVSRGKVGKSVQKLIENVKSIMEPYTATQVKSQKNNTLKDFISIAPSLSVTHLILFNKTDSNVNCRFVRVPRGPSIWFKVSNFTLVKDVLQSLSRPHVDQHLFLEPPLCVTSATFPSEKKHATLIKTFIQHMFPSTNIPTLKLQNVRRVVIFDWNDETEEIEIRQYVINVTPASCSKKVKKILDAGASSTRQLPGIGKLEDISEFFNPTGMTSGEESEFEETKVELSQNLKKRGGNVANEKSKVNLSELGPRLTLKLVKIQEGVNDGEIMYHSYVEKTKEEVSQLATLKAEKEIEKRKRKAIQAENVKRKQSKIEAKAGKKAAKKAKRQNPEPEEDSDMTPVQVTDSE